MTITPSFGDYPDFGSPQGAMSAALLDRVTFGPAASVTIGTFDCTLFKTLRFTSSAVGGSAAMNLITFRWLASVQSPSSFVNQVMTQLGGAGATSINVSVPVLSPAVQIVASAIGVGNFNSLVTLVATASDAACHAPGVYASQFNAALGAGAASTVNVSPVLSGWATILARNNGGQPTVTFVEVLDSAGNWQPIAGVQASVAQQFNTFSYKHPPLQARVTMGNIGVGPTGAWSALTFADLSGG